MSKTQTVLVTKVGRVVDAKRVKTLLGSTLAVEVIGLVAKVADGNDTAYVFPYGIIVDWSGGALTQLLIDRAKPIFAEALPQRIDDSFVYQSIKGKFAIEDDVLLVPTQVKNARLAVSHVLARSVELDYRDLQLDAMLREIRPIPQLLATRAKIGLSGKRVKQLIGEILDLQFALSSSAMPNDKPDLFWEHPKLNDIYVLSARHFELFDRVVVTQQKLGVLHDIFETLRDEKNNHTSHGLEWVIIFLIVFEVVFAFFPAH